MCHIHYTNLFLPANTKVKMEDLSVRLDSIVRVSLCGLNNVEVRTSQTSRSVVTYFYYLEI